MAKAFQKQLLYIKEDQVIYFSGLMKTSLKNLTFFIESVQRILKISLTNEDKIQLKDFGSEFIEEHLRKLFTFNGASREFNLTALGINEIESVLEFYNQHSDNWQSYNFELTKDVFKEPKNFVNALTETYSVYTDNETQNKLIELSKKIISLHKEMDSMDIHQLKGNGNEMPGTSKIIGYDNKNDCLTTNMGFVETLGDNYKTFWQMSEEKRVKRQQTKIV